MNTYETLSFTKQTTFVSGNISIIFIPDRSIPGYSHRIVIARDRVKIAQDWLPNYQVVSAKNANFYYNKKINNVYPDGDMVEKREEFPWLHCYVSAYTLPTKWSQERGKLMQLDSSLNRQRAGELAAAKIAAQARDEIEALEKAVRNVSEPIEDKDVSIVQLYDELQALPSIYESLVDLSQSRTLIRDEQEYREKK